MRLYRKTPSSPRVSIRKTRGKVVRDSPVAHNHGVVGTLSIVTGAGPSELKP